jgi:4-diphosphocytidyl-2-C-methyl-D-erythritol kinase
MHPTSVDLSNKKIVLVLPGIHINTSLAFKDCPIQSDIQPCNEITSQPIETWKENLVNDFEQTVFSAYPELKTIKEQLYASGAIYASMTGTGSTIYGIYDKPPDTNGLFNKAYQVLIC